MIAGRARRTPTTPPPGGVVVSGARDIQPGARDMQCRTRWWVVALVAMAVLCGCKPDASGQLPKVSGERIAAENGVMRLDQLFSLLPAALLLAEDH